MICGKIQSSIARGKVKRKENECISMTREQFAKQVLAVRKKWNSAWSKEFREMDEKKLLETVFAYMKNWMMVRCEEDRIIVLPAVGRLSGFYPEDFEGEKR